MPFNDQEKRFLSQFGRTESGRDLLKILDRMKAHYSTVDDIDTSKDAGAQVEGRKLMKTMIKDLQEAILTQSRNGKPKDTDDYD